MADLNNISPRCSRYLGAIQRNSRAELIQAGKLKLEAAVKFTRTTVAYSGPDKPHLNNSHIAALLLSPEFTHRERTAPCVSSCQIYSSGVNQ